MKTTTCIAALLAVSFAFSAQAGQSHTPAPAGSSSSAGAAASAGASSYAHQGQGQLQGQSQTAHQSNLQATSQTAKQKTAVNVGGQRQGQANSQGQTTTIGGDNYATSAYAPSMYGNNTAPCVKSTSLSFGTIGATGGLSLPAESQNCWAERRADQIERFAREYGSQPGRAGLIYLAGQDPAACAYAESIGLVTCATRANRLNQTQASRIVAAAPTPVCYAKPGRTIVTNWPDKMACARSLGF